MTQAYTYRFTEVHELGPGFFPGNYVAGIYQTAWANMTNHQRGVFVLGTGDMAAGSTVDCQLWQAQDAAGLNPLIIAGKAILQLQQAAGDGNDSVCIEFRTEELDVDAKYSFVAAVVTVGGQANSDLTGAFFLGASNYPPVPVANWTEIVD